MAVNGDGVAGALGSGDERHGWAAEAMEEAELGEPPVHDSADAAHQPTQKRNVHIATDVRAISPDQPSPTSSEEPAEKTSDPLGLLDPRTQDLQTIQDLPLHRLATGETTPDGRAVLRADPLGRRVLAEEGGYEFTGFAFARTKKWSILTAVFCVQVSMNFNAAIYAAAVPGMARHFGVGEATTRLGQFVFLLAYAFGCELWAPWSEELGRKWVLQGSLFLVNVWQIPCALAPGFWTVFGARLLGGLSCAGGSVTLGMVADMWEPAEQQYAVAFVVLSSVAGSVVAPIVGGFVTQFLDWQWAFWIALIFGGAVQVAHLFVPETRSSILLTRGARYLRREYPGCNVYSPDELRGSFFQRVDFQESCKLMWRPYMFLLKEPIVTFLSLLSGFSDALIFTGLDSFGPVLSKWNFNYVTTGLAFIPLLVGYILAYLSFLPVYRKDRKIMNGHVENMKPERRLWWLLYIAPLEPIGLLGFAFCSLGPQEHVHWIAPLIFTALIGIANFAIYMATIDYMVAAYGPYSASATGGNGFCRDFLAGIAALYATPFYSSIAKGTKWQLVIPSIILSGVSVLGCIPVYYFYIHGEKIRNTSPWATALATRRGEVAEERQDAISRVTEQNSQAASRFQSRPGSRPVTPRLQSGNVSTRTSVLGSSRPGSAPPSRLASVVNLSEMVEHQGKAV